MEMGSLSGSCTSTQQEPSQAIEPLQAAGGWFTHMTVTGKVQVRRVSFPQRSRAAHSTVTYVVPALNCPPGGVHHAKGAGSQLSVAETG